MFQAQSYVNRLALFAGNNIGLQTEKPLKYAAQDAKQMAAIFRESGSFEADRIYLLCNQPLKKFQEAMQEIGGRIKELKRKGGKVLALLYYSGHGSAQALHIQGHIFPRRELAKYFEGLNADLRILIVDACESGSLLRSKGGKVITVPDIKIQDNFNQKGTILLSSSSHGEFAQESEEYQGAVFTHHLLNGLKGIADYNGNREISLWEAFNYASVSTRLEKIHGKIEQQNPSFDFDLVGESDVVLTTLHNKKSRLMFTNFKHTEIKVYNSGDMSFKALLILPGRDSIYFNLPTREYLLTYEEGNAVKVAKADLSWGNVASVSPTSFRNLPKADVYNKGGKSFNINPHAIRANITKSVAGPGTAIYIINGYYALKGFSLTHLVGVGWGRNNGSGKYLYEKRNVLRISYTLEKPFFRYRFGQFFIGIDAIFNRVWQQITDIRFSGQSGLPYIGMAKGRNFQSNVYNAGISIGKEILLPYRLVISAAGHAEICAFTHAGRNLDYQIHMFPVFSAGYNF